jgi:hypothetical protein
MCAAVAQALRSRAPLSTARPCGHRAAPTLSHGTRALLGSSMSAIWHKADIAEVQLMSAFGGKDAAGKP